MWTPGVTAGRPMSLPLLPDFAALGRGGDAESLDEREHAVEMALATLEPHLHGGGAKAIKLRGALADGLRAFARAGGGSLDDLLRLLSDLPETASRIAEAPKLAREIADQLIAAIAANPLLRPDAEPLDPERLFAGGIRANARLDRQSLGARQRRGARGFRQPVADDAVLLDQASSEPDRAALCARRGADLRAGQGDDAGQAQRAGARQAGAQIRARDDLRHPGAARHRPRHRLQLPDPRLRPPRLAGEPGGGARDDGGQGGRCRRRRPAEDRRVLFFDRGADAADQESARPYAFPAAPRTRRRPRRWRRLRALSYGTARNRARRSSRAGHR